MKVRISLDKIVLFMLYCIGFITLPYFENYNVMKYIFIILIALYLFAKFRITCNRRNILLISLVLCFICIIVVTSFINRNYVYERDIFFASLVYASIIIECFLLFIYFKKKGKEKMMIGLLYKMTIFFVIVTDILILTCPNLVGLHTGYYFIGNKFDVAYIHILLLSLFLLNYNFLKVTKLSNIKKICFVFFILLSLLMSIYVNTSTGIIGCLLILIFICFRKKNKNFLLKPFMPVIVLLGSSSFLFLFDSLLNNTFMKFLIEDILNRDVTLTGRIWIYNHITEVFSGHLITGYGYGSTYELCMRLLGAPNTQNGLLEILFQFGIFGVIIFLIILYTIFNRKYDQKIMPLVYIIYVYIIIASVEITFGLQFICILALLASLGSKNKSFIK